ncbi:MAG: HNH endonuclease [Acidobacteria bacterium]|nr:HNH endonuclease [Acidobacteriota bacterium]
MHTAILPPPTDLSTSRFWSRVEKRQEDSCWHWLGSIDGRGYGRMGFGTRYFLAHRISYFWSVGPIPKGMFVCHKCDVPACVNPKHLFLGDAHANNQDMKLKGRAKGRGPRGSHNGRARLADSQVEEIRRRYSAKNITQSQLALEYGVDQTTVSCLLRGNTWKHLDKNVANIS